MIDRLVLEQIDALDRLPDRVARNAPVKGGIVDHREPHEMGRQAARERAGANRPGRLAEVGKLGQRLAQQVAGRGDASVLAMHRLEIDRIKSGEEVMAPVEIWHQRAFRFSSRRGGHAAST